MDIRNGIEGLRTLLGVNPAAPSASQAKGAGSPVGNSSFDSDRATLSNAASEVSESVSGDDVRTEKVAAVQSALIAGNYDVAPLAVASKLVDAMLGAVQ